MTGSLPSYFKRVQPNLCFTKSLSLSFSAFYHPKPFCSMEDFLASMWSTLSLSEKEGCTLEIDPNKLSVPKNVIIGKLAMKKHVSLYEVDKGFKIFWNASKEMETTQLGDNLYLFAFKNERTIQRILENQPWSFRGSLLIMDHIHGDECPTALNLHRVPFWVQIHGLQLTAMNRAIGEEVGALIGEVLDFSGDNKGDAIGSCIRVQIMMSCTFKYIVYL